MALIPDWITELFDIDVKTARAEESLDLSNATSRTDVDTLDESEFVQFSCGDNAVTERIVTKHEPALRAHARGFFNSAEAADEIVQETFVRMFIARNQFKPGRPLGLWLYRILVNLCIDRLRTEKRLPNLAPLVRKGNRPALKIADSSPQPDEALIRKEDEYWIMNLVSTLPAKLRLPFERFVIEGKRQSLIATELNESRKAVEMDLYHARELIRKAIYERYRAIAAGGEFEKSTFCGVYYKIWSHSDKRRKAAREWQ